MNDPTEQEIIGIMVDGGKQVCEHARQKWLSYSYASNPKSPTEADEKMRREYLEYWQKVESSIAEVGRRLMEVTE